MGDVIEASARTVQDASLGEDPEGRLQGNVLDFHPSMSVAALNNIRLLAQKYEYSLRKYRREPLG